MARILVISDIHGNAADLKFLLDHEKYDRVFLLGDYIGDLMGYCEVVDGNEVLDMVRLLKESEDNIVLKGNHEAMSCAEQGKGHEKYLSMMKSLPQEVYTRVDGFSIYLTHDPTSLNPQYAFRANIILSGHFHTFGIRNDPAQIKVQVGTLMTQGRSSELAGLLHGVSENSSWADGNLGRTYAIIDTQELFVQIRQIPDFQPLSKPIWRFVRESHLPVSHL
jgi:predicted phosphodiesterase